MKTLEHLIQLCKQEAGKVFIMDEQGEIQLVIMNAPEYTRLKSARVSAVDADIVNREIINAQLSDQDADKGLPFAVKGNPLETGRINPHPTTPAPQVRTDIAPKRDLREEVIDPSFNFDSTEDL